MRKAIIQLLGIGLTPAQVGPAMCVGQMMGARGAGEGAGAEGAGSDFTVPGDRFIRAMRNELRIIVEALAARVAADPDMLWQQIGFDGTGKDGKDFITANIKIKSESTGKSRTLCLRGAFMPEDKSAQKEAEAIRDRYIANGRRLLLRWRQVHEVMFPGEDHGIPDPEGLRLSRLAGGSSVISDGCNQALKMQSIMAEMITASYIDSLPGKQADWDGLSEEEKEDAVRVYKVTCQNHLRNTMLRHGIKEEEKVLNDRLADVLKEFSVGDIRTTLDTEGIVRAAAKEFLFSASSMYAKGRGASFLAWCIAKHPKSMVYVLQRADLGSRLDSSTESALALYMNRKLYVEFLSERIESADDENKLERSLWVSLVSSELIAAIRARAMIYLKIIRPLRFFTNSNTVGFTPADMSTVIQPLESFLKEMEVDGAKMMDIGLDIFNGVGASEGGRVHDLYADWRDDFYARKSHTVDGSSRHPFNRLSANEVFEPQDKDNQDTDELVKVLLQSWATGLLDGIQQTPLKEHVEGGAYSAENITEQMRQDLAGSDTANDMCERIFGIFDYITGRNRGIVHTAASALSQSKVNKDLFWAVPAAARKAGSLGASEPPLMESIPLEEQMSLLEMARQDVGAAKKVNDEEILGQLKTEMRKHEERRERKKRLAVARYARAMELFKKERIVAPAELDKELKKLPSDSKRLALLKEQINIRTLGFGWLDFKTPWSKKGDSSVGTVKDLTSKLKQVFIDESDRLPPGDAPVPDASTKKIRTLGTLTDQAAELQKHYSAAEMKRSAIALRDEEQAKKEARYDSHSRAQPDDAPDPVVGLRVEILCRVEHEVDEEEVEATAPEAADGVQPTVEVYNQWCAAQILAAADGTAAFQKKDARGRSRKVSAGWFFVRYESDDEEEWLRFSDFNCQRVASWRLDLDYLGGSSGGGAAEAKANSSSESNTMAGDSNQEDEEEDEDDPFAAQGACSSDDDAKAGDEGED